MENDRFELKWTQIRNMGSDGKPGSRAAYIQGISCAKVPGGWLLTTYGGGITFYPDPEHKWDGRSLE